MGDDILGLQLTQGEVDYARSYQPTNLLVFDGIGAAGQPTENTEARGASQSLCSGLTRDGNALRPT